MRGQQLTTITDHYILFLTTNVSCVKKKCKDYCDVLHKQHIECILYYKCFSITWLSSPLISVDIKKFFCTYTYCNYYSCSPLLPSNTESNIQNTLSMMDISHHFTHFITTFPKQFLLPSLVLMTDIPKINFLLFIPCIKLVTHNTQPTKCTKSVMYTFIIILKQ